MPSIFALSLASRSQFSGQFVLLSVDRGFLLGLDSLELFDRSFRVGGETALKPDLEEQLVHQVDRLVRQNLSVMKREASSAAAFRASSEMFNL